MLENQDSSSQLTGVSKSSSAIFFDSSSRIFGTEIGNYSDNMSPDYALLAIKRWKLVFVVTFLGLCLSWLALSFVPKSYTSSAMVKLGSYAPPTEGPIGRQIQLTTEKQDYLVSQVAMMKSYSLAESVLKTNPAIFEALKGNSQFNLKKSKLKNSSHPDIPANLLERYQNVISYEMVSGTSLIRITAKAKDPFLAEKIANAHAKAYILMVQSNLSRLAKTNLYYLEKRGKEAEEKYFETERASLKYAKDNALAGSDVEQIRKTLIEKYQSLYGRLNEAILQRARSESKHRELRGTSTRSVRFDPEVSKEFSRLSTIDAQIKVIKGLGASGSGDFLNELKEERSALFSALRDYNSRQTEASELEYKAASEAESLLRKELQRTIDDERDLYSKMVEFNSLQEKSKTAKDQLTQVQTRLDDAKLNAKNNQHIVMLVDKALIPSGPSSPNRNLFLGLGLMGSFVIGIFLTIALDSVDQTIGSVADVEKSTSIPMLGMIPSFSESKSYGYGYGDEVGEIRKTINSLSDSLTNILAIGDLRNSFSKLSSISKQMSQTFKPLVTGDGENSVSSEETDFLSREGEVAIMHAPEIAIKENVVTYTKQWSRLSEAFNEVFITLQSMIGEKSSSILLASGDKGDGKSTVAANLAISFANAGKRTVLIDADFRLPTMNRFFDFSENLVGVSDFLLGHVGPFDTVYKTQAANLSIIPVGTYVGAYSQLGSGKKFKELIELLSDQYDVILIDGPPILHVADGLALSRIVDGVALVVRNGKTLRETAKWVVGRLNQVGGKVLGIVYNDVPNMHNFSRYTY